MEKIGNNDKKIETKKQAPSIRVNKLYSICSAAYMFAAVVIMFGAGIGGIEFPSWVKQAALMVFMILALWIPMAIKTENLERPHPTDVGWGFYGLAPVKPR